MKRTSISLPEDLEADITLFASKHGRSDHGEMIYGLRWYILFQRMLQNGDKKARDMAFYMQDYGKDPMDRHEAMEASINGRIQAIHEVETDSGIKRYILTIEATTKPLGGKIAKMAPYTFTIRRKGESEPLTTIVGDDLDTIDTIDEIESEKLSIQKALDHEWNIA